MIPQPTAPVEPGAGPLPGRRAGVPRALSNFGISDMPSNYDYTFRAGIFAGDYERSR